MKKIKSVYRYEYTYKGEIRTLYYIHYITGKVSSSYGETNLPKTARKFIENANIDYDMKDDETRGYTVITIYTK